jgi:hypothetical protein
MRAVGLYDARASGTISVIAESTSGYAETKLVVTTLVSSSVEVDFSTACLVQTNGSQRIGLSYEKTTGSYLLVLSGNSTYTLYFSSRCLDRSRSAPLTGSTFANIIDISRWTSIVNALREKYDQSGVWSVTESTSGWTATYPSGDNGGSDYMDLSGRASWWTSRNRMNIKVARVSNLSKSITSGSLRLRVWATRSRYSGRRIPGHILGTRNLNPLQPGYYYSNISGYVRYTRPRPGRYYTTITLEEYNSGFWVVKDYINFRGRTKF